MIRKRRVQGRRLGAEQLERRELLAADFGAAAAMPVEVVTADATPAEVAPPQQRERTEAWLGDPPIDGVQHRPRDRDSQDAEATVAMLEAAAVDEAVQTQAQLQQQAMLQTQLQAKEQAQLQLKIGAGQTDAALAAMTVESGGDQLQLRDQLRVQLREQFKDGSCQDEAILAVVAEAEADSTEPLQLRNRAVGGNEPANDDANPIRDQLRDGSCQEVYLTEVL